MNEAELENNGSGCHSCSWGNVSNGSGYRTRIPGGGMCGDVSMLANLCSCPEDHRGMMAAVAALTSNLSNCSFSFENLQRGVHSGPSSPFDVLVDVIAFHVL